MASTYEIPFDANGNMLSYPDFRTAEKKSVYVFPENMTVDGFSRGRSSAQFTLIDSKGKKYCMFMSDMFDMISRTDILKGQVAGEWTFVKKGTNYGLKFV